MSLVLVNLITTIYYITNDYHKLFNSDHISTWCIFFRVNASVKRVGGGYGAKITRSAQTAAACALGAYLTRRYYV